MVLVTVNVSAYDSIVIAILTNTSFRQIPSFRQSERRERRGISSLYLAVKVDPKYLLEILTSFANAHSSTVVFGFAYGSSRKASIKEFHQLVSLTVTTPLRMTDFGDCFL